MTFTNNDFFSTFSTSDRSSLSFSPLGKDLTQMKTLLSSPSAPYESADFFKTPSPLLMKDFDSMSSLFDNLAEYPTNIPSFERNNKEQKKDVVFVTNKTKKEKLNSLPEKKNEKENTTETDDVTSWKPTSMEQNNNSDMKVSVTMKTRTVAPSAIVPQKMYSSLIYDLAIQVCQTCPNGLIHHEQERFTPQQSQRYTHLHAKLFVINKETGEEMALSESVSSSSVVECSITKQPQGNILKGSMKMSPHSKLSFHKTKKEFMFEMRFYAPSNLTQTLLVLRTNSFKVYCRKPDNKKRKRTNSGKISSRKKRKTNFERFQEKLDQLCGSVCDLNEEERKKALKMMVGMFGGMRRVEKDEMDFFA